MGQPLLHIVHEGDGYVVVNKPPGLLSVPGKGPENQDCVSARVRTMYPGADGPITVHRLDMDTSGLIVCGLSRDAQRNLSKQFEQRLVEKRYIAVVQGRVEGESGTVDVPMRMDPTNRPYQVIDKTHDRPAVTCWKVMGYVEDAWGEARATRLELTPRTGRTHQLRVHCAYQGHGCIPGGGPILGDVLYGPPRVDPDEAGRLLLHAWELGFSEPVGGERVRFKVDPDF